MNIAPTILIVEDEPTIRASLAMALREAGYLVSESSSGEDAVGKLAASDIVGIVTDIRLGAGLSGWDVARRARQQYPRMVIVYISGDSAADWASEGVPTSIMIQKPFPCAQILNAITGLLENVNLPVPRAEALTCEGWPTSNSLQEAELSA